MKTTILLVCLDNMLAKQVAENLCSETGKFFLDSKEMLEYSLANRDEIITNCGLEYLKNQENKFIIGLLDYENTIITMNYELFVVNDNYEVLNSGIETFYLRLKKDSLEKCTVNIINKISYLDRDKVLQTHCNHTIDCNNKYDNQIVKEILSK